MHFAGGIFPPPSALAESINSAVSPRRRETKTSADGTLWFGCVSCLTGIWGQLPPSSAKGPSRLLSQKWKHYETTNQHLQNKTILSSLVIIVNQQSREREKKKKGAFTALCNSNKFPGKNKKIQVIWCITELVCNNGMAASKLKSDCRSNCSVIMRKKKIQFLLKQAVTNRGACRTSLVSPRCLVILANWD